MTRSVLLWGAAASAIVIGGATPAQAQLISLPTILPAGTASSTTPTIGTETTPDPSTARPIKPQYRNIRGFYRNIRGFWGDVNPFYRNIRGFWGDVDPFYRNIRGFWGSVDPATMATAAGAPIYANVGPFWEGLGTQWDAIAADWQTAGAYEGNEGKYATIADRLRSLTDSSGQFWGAAVTKSTGKSFNAGFADPLFARFGIDPNDPSSLAKLPANEQSHLFIDWYDGLMEFSGTDHVDWWMKSVNWTPKLTQTQGGGSDAVIGLVDFFVAADDDIRSKLIYSGGVSAYTNGHGSGVGSLMVASHDGKGVMGIAPNAKVAAYNPFDSTGSADWSDVRNGIRAVTAAGASVVNLSLGVPGSTLSSDWAGVFRDPAIKLLGSKTLYVIAAGNDGITQTGNVDMTGALDSTFIVVGSVDPLNTISDFSNRPGRACITTLGLCLNLGSLSGSGSLMNRFIVAPGELVLVADGAGGVTRESGTSVAAPLVSGAIALLQDRWPWLKKYPSDVADIILKSAKDLGAPGVDPVYGVGLLDVEAAQSPLSFDALTFYQFDGKNYSAAPVRSLKGQGIQSNWETKGMYLTAFEQTKNSYRDFLIPLSTRLVGTTKDGEYFQDFVYNRMAGWLTGTKLAAAATPPTLGFSDVQHFDQIGTVAGWTMALSGRVADGYLSGDGYLRPHLNSGVMITAPSGRVGFGFGSGDGAVLLGGVGGFQMTSDFDPQAGGVNPLLGFASGGAHVSASVGVGRTVTVTFGSTQQTRSRDRDLLGTDARDRSMLGNLARYRAQASNVRVEYQPSNRLSVAAAYTHLAEPNALLGVRSLDSLDFRGGSATDGVTLSTNLLVGYGVALFGSATGSRAHSVGNDGALQVGDGGLIGSAYQIGLAKDGVLGRRDRIRLSLAQPLTMERGNVNLTTVEVTDRDTGQIGTVTRPYDVSATNRRLVAEGLYGAPLLGGRAELSLFGRGELRRTDATTPALLIGTRAQLSF
jgi:hypothetical protein